MPTTLKHCLFSVSGIREGVRKHLREHLSLEEQGHRTGSIRSVALRRRSSDLVWDVCRFVRIPDQH